MEPQLVHHIEIWIEREGDEFVTDFCSKFGFRRSAHRKTSYCHQWLVTASHQVRIVITYENNPDLKNGQEGFDGPTIININNTTKTTEHSADLLKKDPYVTWRPPSPPVCDLGSSGPFDDWGDGKAPSSVFNVSLVVNDIQRTVDHLQKCGVTIVRPLQTVSDPHGSVTLATVRSCVGNVVHTLIDRHDYKGDFLPGFIPMTKEEEEILITGERKEEEEKRQTLLVDKNKFSSSSSPSSFFTNFDHVTFAVHAGTSTSVLQWYEECFGMKRFNVNSGEDPNEGFVINLPGIALRLKALEYWKCAEVGLCTNNTDGSNNILFVIAESLPGSASNQVDTFLVEHGGPGIQHIGLLTHTILDTVDWLRGQDVQFVEPPYTYYIEVEPLLKMCKLKDCLERLQELGILIDVENREAEDEEPRYLMQKFTRPLFDKNTFFLEVIQRNGALGFGAANIIALWKSLQLMLDKNSQEPQQN